MNEELREAAKRLLRRKNGETPFQIYGGDSVSSGQGMQRDLDLISDQFVGDHIHELMDEERTRIGAALVRLNDALHDGNRGTYFMAGQSWANDLADVTSTYESVMLP